MSDLETRLDQAIGDRYRLEREIGRGGMAVIYLAEDRRHRRRVAIKVLEPELARAIGAERFLREIEIAARLTHPNILPLHDSGDAGDALVYYVMPFVDGESLRSRLDRERQLPLDDALRIAREVADALAYAHSQGVIHRDIKPENILLTAGNLALGQVAHALVSDFGIARAVGEAGGDRLTHTGLTLGTPAYMSPEQAAGEREVDVRSDIYSLGCVVYEMLAGEPPFTGPTPQAVLARKAMEPVPRLRVVRETVPAAVEAVVAKSLARTPVDRFATAAQFGEALTRAIAAPAAEAGGPPNELRVAGSRSRARTRAPWLFGSIAGAVVLVTAAVMLFRSRNPSAVRPDYIPLTSFAESATSPAISPDGRYLAFILGESTFFGPGQIFVKTLPGGEPVQLTHDELFKMGPKFSADGSHITYTTFSGSSWDTWSVPVLGRQAPRLVLENAEGLTWIGTPDGTPRVLFSETTGRDVQMGIVTATESRAQHRTVYMPPETGMAHRSHLSPDGKHVLVIEMDYYSWLPCRLVPFEGSNPGKSIGPIPAQCTDAAWSPDGKSMYFSANAGNGFHIWRQRFPDGNPEQLTFGVTEEEGIALDPDGNSLVTSIGTRQSTIWVHDARGDRQITSQGYAMLPSFSSDAKTLYYLVREGGSGSYVSGALWSIDMESGERQRLLPDFLMQTYDISTDGTRVVFIAADDTTRSPLWVARLDGRTPPRRLVRNDALMAFYGAGGDVVFAARERDRNFVYRIKEDGTELRTIVQASNLASVSPDGRWMAVWVSAAGDELSNALRVYSVSGASPTLVCAKCGAPPSLERGPWPPSVSWSPDGRFVYLEPYESPYAVPVRPGEALPPMPSVGLRTDNDVAALPGARRITQPKVFLGPDPSVYAFTKVTIHRNLYRIPVQ